MDRYLAILHQYWGYPNFRGIQRQIIESIGSGRDTLGLMPTGGGKSLTFQVPALALKGVCLVVTPLISLMKDQVDHLRHLGIQASAIYSGMTRDQILSILENAIFGGVKLLYISPERLRSELFLSKLAHMKLSFLTVDEAHCISQWGYDFRPSYLEIIAVRKLLPQIPVLALTATATPNVVEDIQNQLGFKEKNLFKMSFARDNLAYVVRETTDKVAELVHLLMRTEGSAIVYCRSRKQCRDLALTLCSEGVGATWYHAGLDPHTKEERQDDWQQNKVRVIVATNAFGMGIDKPDVRLVVHVESPNSIEEYFQEAGRAGRDGLPAQSVVLYCRGDEAKLRARVARTFPEKEVIRQIYDEIAYFFQIGINSGIGTTWEFSIEKFCSVYHRFPLLVHSSLLILQRAGYLQYELEPDTRARVRITISHEDFYNIEGLSPKEHMTLEVLARTYGGLFSDFSSIDETFLAQKIGYSREELYLLLTSLSRKRIIEFVPRRNVPQITYLKDRIDGSDVILGPEVYEERKKSFIERIDAMISYLTCFDVCRSRQLLRYFGETDTRNCGHCDVCKGHKMEKDQLAHVRLSLLHLLSDGQKHPICEVLSLPFERDMLKVVIESLIDEEIIIKGEGCLWQNGIGR